MGESWKNSMNQILNKTIYNIDKNKCTGCKLCQDVCPKQAISFEFNEEGFWHPVINNRECINCGICKKKCPVLSKPLKTIHKKDIYALGVWNKNREIRWESTSGGFFTTLAEYLIKQGFYIVGAIYGADFAITHIISKDISDIKKMRQSKYAQSNTESIYKKTMELLIKGEQVLFCGTPCQVAAIYQIADNYKNNLISMDFVCAGVSSPVVFQKYLEWLEDKYHSKIRRVWFKNKREGWDQIGTEITFRNGKKYFRIGSRDPFMVSFVKDCVNIRKSCFECQYRELPHISDFTAGDFWGVEKFYPNENDNLGITALMINTERGVEIFGQIKDKFNVLHITTDEIIKYNPTVIQSLKPGNNRHIFLTATIQKGLRYTVAHYSSYRGISKILMDYVYLKKKIKKLLKI